VVEATPAPETPTTPETPPASGTRPTPEIPPAPTASRSPVSDSREGREAERLVARGTEAIGLQRFTDARESFRRALQLEPGLASATQGLAQVDAALASDGFAGARHEGAALEGQERWREATGIYAEALTKDASLGFAQAGLRRARERAELSDRLDGYLERSSQLTSREVRAEARQWLLQARTLTGGPVLRSQIARVELLLKDYE
jgi:tetratricopeptide (TPR) repeat protein